MEVDRRVLLLEAAQGLTHLLLVALRLGLDRERHHRPRHRRQLQRDLHLLRGDHVARVGLLELRDRADVARAELVGVLGVLALRRQQLADALLGVDAAVVHLRVVLEHALVDAEEVHAPGVRVRERLEDEGDHVLRLVRLERHAVELDRAALRRRGQVLHEGVQQPVDGEVARGSAAGDGEQVPLGDALLESGHRLLVRDLLALEVALHERVRDLGHLVHQLLAVLLGLRLQVLGNLDLGAVLAAVAVVAVGLHVDQVDHALELVLAGRSGSRWPPRAGRRPASGTRARGRSRPARGRACSRRRCVPARARTRAPRGGSW